MLVRIVRRRPSLFSGASLVIFALIACGKVRETSLIGRFVSHESPAAVRSRLASEWSRGWTERHEGLDRADRRPRYGFVIMSGPFQDLGFAGNLKLTFFNDRLMSAQFSPLDGVAYGNTLRQRMKSIPTVPGAETVISRHTLCKYYIDADGAYRFLWEDQNLMREWEDWIWKYS